MPDTSTRLYQPLLNVVHITPAIAAIAVTSATAVNPGWLTHVPPNALHVVVQLSGADCRYHMGALLGVADGEAPSVTDPVGVCDDVLVFEAVAVLLGVCELVRVVDAVMLLLAVSEGSAPSVTEGVGEYDACGHAQMERSELCDTEPHESVEAPGVPQ